MISNKDDLDSAVFFVALGDLFNITPYRNKNLLIFAEKKGIREDECLVRELGPCSVEFVPSQRSADCQNIHARLAFYHWLLQLLQCLA